MFIFGSYVPRTKRQKYEICEEIQLMLYNNTNALVVIDLSSVLMFCPNQLEQVNEISVSRNETEQNQTKSA